MTRREEQKALAIDIVTMANGSASEPIVALSAAGFAFAQLAKSMGCSCPSFLEMARDCSHAIDLPHPERRADASGMSASPESELNEMFFGIRTTATGKRIAIGVDAEGSKDAGERHLDALAVADEFRKKAAEIEAAVELDRSKRGVARA